MVKLPQQVKKAIQQQEVFPVATSSDDGIPNVVYIKFLKPVDDKTILIADNYLHKTRKNILNNGNITFTVLDDDKGSFQVKGISERLTKGQMYNEVQNWVPKELPREAAVVMHVKEVYNGAKKLF